MATFDYNPITGNLDLVGSGASYINGVVADPTALPITVGTPPLDSVYLAKAGSGVWLINRKPAGLYCRVANNGNAADWTHLGAFPEVNADGNWELYNSADPTKELKFDLSGIATGTTRTITVPNKNVTLDDANDARTPTAHNHAASAITSGVLDNARINFAAPSSIGSTTANSGAFTTLTANNGTQTSTAFAPALTLAQTWNTSGHVFSAFTIDITNTAASSNSTFLLCRAGGNSAFEFRTGGTLVVPASGSFNCSGTVVFSGQVSVNSGGSFAFTSSSTSGFSGQDTFIRRDAASTIAFRDLANPQTFRIYNTTDSGLTNFERGFMRWSSNVLEIGTEGAGTGNTTRELRLFCGANEGIRIQSGAVLVRRTSFSINNVQITNGTGTEDELGTSLNLRPFSTGNVIINSGLIKFHGTTSSFPALKRSSTALQVRLADDSAFAPLSCGALTLNGNLDASTRDIVTDTTTGTKIGTGTTQKLGFFNATPVIQQAAVADATDAATVITQLNALLSRMRTLGLIAT